MSSSLSAAIHAAQEAETVLAEMNVPLWAKTFHSSEEEIRRLWEEIAWKRSQEPKGGFEEMY